VLYKNTLTESEWSKLADVAASPTNGLKTVTDVLGGTGRFYRLVTPAWTP